MKFAYAITIAIAISLLLVLASRDTKQVDQKQTSTMDQIGRNVAKELVPMTKIVDDCFDRPYKNPWGVLCSYNNLESYLLMGAPKGIWRYYEINLKTGKEVRHMKWSYL